MQTPISRKLRKVDNTSMSEFTTEVTALVKNLTGSPPVKLTRVLIDTGCSKTLIKKQYVPNGLSSYCQEGYAYYLEYKRWEIQYPL
jgi:hypothetical protein